MQPDKKGDFYVAVIEKPGRAGDRRDLRKSCPKSSERFPWPKSMRWGAPSSETRRADSGCGRCIPSSPPSGRKPRSPTSCRSKSTASPPATRRAAIASWRRSRSRCAARRLLWLSSTRPRSCSMRTRRRDIILTEAKQLAFAQGLELVEDDGLLAEVAGLVEWPVVLMGSFDGELPANPRGSHPRHHPQQPEMLRAARRRARQAGRQVPAGLEHRSRRRRRGHRRRQRARHPRPAVGCQVFLRDRFKDASSKIGCQSSRTSCFTRSSARRPSALSALSDWPPNWRRWSAPMPVKAKRAARLCKADLLTEVVGEFPELQGTMGKYYAEAQGEDEAVAHAMRGSLPAERAGRSGAERSGVGRRRAGGQDRHAGRILGDR